MKATCNSIKSAIFILFLSLLLSGCAKTVVRIVDGDTIVLSNGNKIRLIGVDTPESHYNKKIERDVVRSKCKADDIIKMGAQSADYLSNLLLGNKIRLKYDNQRKDMYGRSLGYVFTKDGTFINEKIIADGYGRVYLSTSFKFKKKFKQAETDAKAKKKGLWVNECGL
jgi:micrococcal nuclease